MGDHTVRVTARGARPYPDPAQPSLPLNGGTLSVECTFSVGSIGRLRLPTDGREFAFNAYPDQRLRRQEASPPRAPAKMRGHDPVRAVRIRDPRELALMNFAFRQTGLHVEDRGG